MRWSAVPVVLVLALGGCESAGGAASGPAASSPASPVSSTSPTSPTSSAPAPPPRLEEFASRPDLAPPKVEIDTARPAADPGYVFLLARFGARDDGDPQGYALAVDQHGSPVWTKRFDDDGTFPNDLAVQTYRGKPVLTYWRGSSPEKGWGNGEYVILDQSYRRIATVRAGHGLHADLHDLVITPRNTALLLAYPTAKGEPSVREGVVQEVDIATGKMLFEWHSIDHVGVDESAAPLPHKKGEAYDYFHVNSVDEDADGNLLVSARHTKALYKIDRRTGDVVWRLGGAHSDFTGDGTEIAWQHDARWLGAGRISVFDNASNLDNRGPASSVRVLAVDERAHTAKVVSAFANPDGLTSGSQGNDQLMPSGNSFVGWGSRPGFTEFGRDGAVLLDGSLPEGTFSYRAHLESWTGRPAAPPRAAVRDGSVYASWNGATGVARWRVLAGSSADDLAAAREVARTGFETSAEVPDGAAYVAVEALDAGGRVLRRSAPVRVS